jgi:hypothetical protein
LAHYLAQLYPVYAGPEAVGQQFGVEGGAQELAHRRQLRRITDEQQAVGAALKHKAHEVVEQASFAESLFVGNHGSLVHDVEHFLLAIGLALKTETLSGRAAGLAVDFFVDSAGWHARVSTHHLGGAAGGGHQGVLAL